MDDFWIDRWPEIVRVAMHKGASLVSLQGWQKRRKIPGDWKIALVEAGPDFGEHFELSELSTTSLGNSGPGIAKAPKACTAA